MDWRLFATKPKGGYIRKPVVLNDILKKCLLNCEAYENILQSNGIAISILVDTINEKLFDMLCDTAIIFDGDRPALVEDYIDELKGMVEQ